MSEFITPDIPVQKRNLTQELDAIYRADAKYAPQQFALEQQYGPGYNRLNIRNLAEGVVGYTDESGNYIPGQLELARRGTAMQRAGDISDVERYGGRAVAASLTANPFLSRALLALRDRSDDSPLLQQLNTAAEQGLASNGALSAEDVRDLQQQSRAGFASRGMLNGPQSFADEILSRDSAKRARIAAAQQFASGVQGLNQGQNAFVGDVARISASSLADPYQAVLSRPGIQAGSLQPTTGTRAYNPFDAQSYGQDLFTYNANAQNNKNIALSNAQANTRSSIATIASGFIGSDERLKENIVRVGTSPSGIPIYEFNYNDVARERYGLRMSERFRGVMAQDVEKIKPAAVHTDGNGYKLVDYALLDVSLELVNAAERKAA